jgi:hypothetical protein
MRDLVGGRTADAVMAMPSSNREEMIVSPRVFISMTAAALAAPRLASAQSSAAGKASSVRNSLRPCGRSGADHPCLGQWI